MPSFVRTPRRPFRDRGGHSSSTTLPAEANISEIAMTTQEVSPTHHFEDDADAGDEDALSGSFDEHSNRWHKRTVRCIWSCY